MGCGASKHGGEDTTVPSDRRSRPKAQDEEENEGGRKDVRKEAKSKNMNWDNVGINDIDVDPSQFITEKTESIYANYSMKEKIGEGMTSTNG